MKGINIKKVFLNRSTILLIICILIIVFLSFYSKAFLSSINIRGMLNTIAFNLIPAIGMTILLISRGFDLSIGANLALTTTIIAKILVGLDSVSSGINIEIILILLILLGFIISIIIGFVNGFIIGNYNINPFIATLAMMYIVRSLALNVSGGKKIGGFPNDFLNIARFQIVTVPIVVYISFTFLIIFYFLLRKNKFFRQTYLVGNNERAAILMGIKVIRMKLILYCLMAFLASMTGLLIISRFNHADPTQGELLGFTSTAAAIIGGASIRGGRGSIIGTFLGVVLVTLVMDAMVIMEINPRWGNFAAGLILLLVVVVDSFTIKSEKI